MKREERDVGCSYFLSSRLELGFFISMSAQPNFYKDKGKRPSTFPVPLQDTKQRSGLHLHSLPAIPSSCTAVVWDVQGRGTLVNGLAVVTVASVVWDEFSKIGYISLGNAQLFPFGGDTGTALILHST